MPQRQLRVDELQMCATTAGRQSPPAEWLLIRDSRSLMRAGQNRRAIIDAGTAAEIAMTALIDKYLDGVGTDEPVKKALAEKYRALEGRESLLRTLQPGLLSDQLKRDLIWPPKPRNSCWPRIQRQGSFGSCRDGYQHRGSRTPVREPDTNNTMIVPAQAYGPAVRMRRPIRLLVMHRYGVKMTT